MVRLVSNSYSDISLLVSCILMPHVFEKLDKRGQSFIALLQLIDGIRAQDIAAFIAFNEKNELAGAAWGKIEDGEFVVHSAFKRHVNTEPYITEMMEHMNRSCRIESFVAYVPQTYRYVIVGLGMQGWEVAETSTDHQFIGQDDQSKPCVKLVKRFQHA